MAHRRVSLVGSGGVLLLALCKSGWAQEADTTRAGKVTHDSLASGVAIPGPLLRLLPVDDPRAALPVSPGVVLRSGPGEVGITVAPQLQIRGGTTGGAAAYVDGAPVRFETLGSQNLVLGANSLDQVGVTTGVPTASVADARDGVVNYVTRGGGARFGASVRAETDGMFGDGSSVGYNRFDGEVGGPFPGIRNLTWFVSAGLTGQGSPYYGSGAADQPTFVMGGIDTVVTYTNSGGSTVSQTLPTYVQYSGSCGALGTGQPGGAINSNYGYDCVGQQRPMDWATQTRAQGKARYSYGGGSSLALTLVGSELQRRFSPGAVINVPGLYEGLRSWSRLAVVNWSQLLRQAGDLRLDVNMSIGTDKAQQGLLVPGAEIGTRAPGLWIELSSLNFTGLDSIPFPLTDQIIRNIRSNSGLRAPYLHRDDLANAQPYRLNPFGLQDQGWYTQGLDGTLSFASERRLNGHWAITWDVSRAHHVLVGIDATKTDLTGYSSSLLSQVGSDAFVEDPKRTGVFGADRLEIDRFTADLGLRVDWYSPGGEFANVPGRIFTNPSWDPAAATDDAAYQRSVAAVFTPGRTQTFVSPRLRGAYRLPQTAFRVGFGSVVAPPVYAQLFGGNNSDLAFTNFTDAFGRDVDYVTNSILEGGVRQSLGSAVALDVGVYNRSFDGYAYRIQPFDDPANPGRNLNVNTLVRLDGGRGTGVDAQLDWNPVGPLSGSLAYSFLDVPETAPQSGAGASYHTLNVMAVLQVPSDWHSGSIWGAMGRDVNAALSYRLTSGLPYDQLINTGAGDVVGPVPNAPLSGGFGQQTGASLRLPMTASVDLRLSKTVHTGRISWMVYLDARNFLDQSNQIGAYTETGSTTNGAYQARTLTPELIDLQTEAQVNGVLLPGDDIDLRPDCSTWSGAGVVDCVALRRVEQRFGNGDGIYTLAEQQRALNTYYDSFYGAWRFYAASRTLRLALAVTF